MIVLNVDDRQDNRYLFDTILRAAGHDVYSAADGAEALELLKNIQCDLIVSDVVMPGMDGFQLCREVKSNPVTRDIPFVFFTAVYTDAKDEQFALSLGATKFLVKPLEPDQLVDQLLQAAAIRAPAPPSALVGDSAGFLEAYNRRVVQKLEAKLAEIERLGSRIRASEARLRALVEGTSDAVYIKDRSGRYLTINAAGARFLARAAESVLGRTDTELYDEATARALATVEQRLLKFGAVEAYDETLRLAGEKGQRQFHSVRGPLRDDTGAIVGTFGISRDVTERRRTEEQIRKLSRAVEQSPVSIIITNAEGNIEYVNPHFSAITGYAADEVLGRNPRLLKSGRHPVEFYSELWSTITSGHDWHGILENRRKNGDIFPEQTVIAPFKDESGKVTHFIAIKEDITERLQLEEQLRQSQKMDAIGRLAGGVAHDFNNLLTIIQLEAATLATNPALDADATAGVRQITAATQRATALTRKLLAFSRKEEKEEQEVDLCEIVGDLAKLVRRILGEDIKLSTQLPAEPVVLRADPGMLEQVLLNLAVNARDAMPSGGSLRIGVETVEIDEAHAHAHSGATPGLRAHIEVSDTGTGIAPEHLGRIFEPFFTTKAAGKGTGLGLATVYGIMQQHRGWIVVDTALGKGTTFHLYLPALPASAATVGEEATERPLPRGSETVLLAEDDDQIRNLVQAALERQGYTVLPTANGSDAIAALLRHSAPVHLLIADLIMPGGINGRQLADQALVAQPALRTIFISGYPADVVNRHLKLKADDIFLHKPFASRTLLEAVRNCLDRPAHAASG
jgi:PAS domain S-box-containing protein